MKQLTLNIGLEHILEEKKNVNGSRIHASRITS